MRKLILALLLILAFAAAGSALAAQMPDIADEASVSGEILISAAGDCTLGGDIKSGIDRNFSRVFKKKGSSWFFSSVKEIFLQDDLTLVNLEGPLTDASKHVSKRYVMRGQPSYAGILAQGGVDCASVANNHTQDFGQEGLQDTLDALGEAGIDAFGGRILLIREVNGIKVGLLGFDRWNDSLEPCLKTVREARSQCDLLIVYVHWGEEYRNRYNEVQQKTGHRLIDAGADLVLGSHPHVIQGIERYRNRYIVYSMGNFCFGGNTNPKDKRCFIFQQRFALTEDGLLDCGIRVIPCSITSAGRNDYRPTPLTGKQKEKVLQYIASLSDVEGAVYLGEEGEEE